MAPGDTVEVGVGLANNIVGSGKDAPIALTLTASGGLEVVGDATQTLKVNERGEASTKFSVRAKPGAQAVLEFVGAGVHLHAQELQRAPLDRGRACARRRLS